MDQVAKVFFNGTLTGYLTKSKDEYVFRYDSDFLSSEDAFPIGHNFPLSVDSYRSNRLFPFFEGLVSEGWLLKIQSQSAKIDERDFFSMLLENGQDLIGGIRIQKV